MKSIYEGYPSKKEFVVEGITGLIWGFVSFFFFIFFMVPFLLLISIPIWAFLEVIQFIGYADLITPLEKPAGDCFTRLAPLLFFSMIHFIVLRGALKKKERAFIIFYPIGLAVSILFFYNFGVFR
jgi:hypothetical protein